MNNIPAQLQEQDDQTWISVSDVARFLSINESTAKSYAAKRVFKSIGKGNGLRVLLGDVRKYADRRDPQKSQYGKMGSQTQKTQKLSSSVVPASDESSGAKASLAVTACSAQIRTELDQLNDRLTLLLTRKAELEETVRAFETIERFFHLSSEGTTD